MRRFELGETSLSLLLGFVFSFGALASSTAEAQDRVVLDEALVRLAITESWEAQSSPGELEVVALPKLFVRAPDATLVVHWPTGLDRPGPRAVPVSAEVQGRTVARGLANVLVRVERTVWTLKRSVEREEVLSGDMLSKTTQVFEREPLRLFQYDPERRYRFGRALEVGNVLKSTDVWPLPAVDVGDEIFLVSKVGSASASVAGRVRSRGDVGDVISVLNTLTGKIVRARLTSENSAVLQKPSRGRSKKGSNR